MNDPAKLAAPLAAALTALTLTLDEPGVDLAASLADFEAAAQLAVSSFAGLAVHATFDGHELGFTTLDEHTAAPDITTSLRLAISPSPYPTINADAFPSIVLILYATSPGAFVDLRADLDWLLASRAHDVALDEDLSPPRFRRIDIALNQMSRIDQATGVLIGRGNTLDQAHQELARLSSSSGRSLHAEAEHLLAAIDPDPSRGHDLIA